MKLQVLLSTMNQKDISIIKDMNINTEAIIINQCDKFNYQETKYKGKKIKLFSLNEIGIGLSRNTAFMRSDADICLFADDDVRYVKDYEKIIVDEFNDNPKADIIFFNLHSKNPNRPEYIAKEFSKVRFYNSLRYGACRIAIRREKLLKSNVSFSLLFGGGAKYSSGEDSLFIYQCIKNGLNAYSSPKNIGTVKQEKSTWFRGYNDKFFHDKGVLYRYLSPKFYHIYVIYYVTKNYRKFGASNSILKVLKMIFKGAKNAK